MKWAARIKNLRSRLGCSRASLAAHLNVGVSTLHGWEAGRHTPSPILAERIEALERADFPSPPQINWAERVRKVRQKHGWASYYAMAMATGIPAPTIYRWETGSVNPSRAYQQRIEELELGL